MLDQSVFVHYAVHVATRYVAALLDVQRIELPGGGTAQSRYIHALGYVDGAGELVDVLEGTLDAVEDAAQDAGSQLHGEGFASTEDGVADCYSAGLFVHLCCVNIEIMSGLRLS